MTPPICVEQTENNPEDSKRAADHYRTVCIPDLLERWKVFADVVTGKWTWMYAERARREDRRQNPAQATGK